MKNRAALFFLLMLWAHVGHALEETWGRFWLLERFGLAAIIAINWALLLIPFALLFFILNRKRWAYQLGLIYAGFMGLQGFGHNIAVIVTSRYFDGFAGGFSGFIMAPGPIYPLSSRNKAMPYTLLSRPLIRALMNEMPEIKSPNE